MSCFVQLAVQNRNILNSMMDDKENQQIFTTRDNVNQEFICMSIELSKDVNKILTTEELESVPFLPQKS